MFIKRSIAKNKDGSRREYFQLAESIRVNGKPRHRVIVTLGRAGDADTTEKIKKMAESLMKACEEFQLLDLSESLKADYSKEFGPCLVFKRLFTELGMEKILRSQFEGIDTDFDITEALFNMILNRISDPSSKRQMTLWEFNTEGIKSFDLHQYYRALDYLVEHKDKIETSLFFQMRDLFNTELDIVLFGKSSTLPTGGDLICS